MFRKSVFLIPLALLVVSQILFAAGGTSIVAQKGQDAYVSKGWAEGVAEIVNDPARTTGWNDWFSEWSNDVNHYAYDIKSSDDVNRLIAKLDNVKGTKELHLCFLKEPRGLGWVTSIDAGNNIPVIFSTGDPARVLQWYNHVRKPFGVIEFLDMPVAVPPTLTLFVQHDAIKLEELKIPEGMVVKMDYLPRLFHKWNTKQEQEQMLKAKAAETENVAVPLRGKELDDATKQTIDEIEQFLQLRNQKER